jgi:murein tripeptide amidase MpaA
MEISAAFDSGNIEVLGQGPGGEVRLAIRKDVGDEHMQWFHFRVSGAKGQDCVFRIENASAASYPVAWVDYRACASSDRQTWTRVETSYEGGALVIRHRPEGDLQWYAYFAPYSLERHAYLLARCQGSPMARLDRLGATLDGRDLDRITVGEGSRTLWIIGRQHPGESMASWWMEGLLGRLLDPADALARRLRGLATLHIVPNMNPDGSTRGHLRCNASGANLNREWHAPTLERSPEVLHTLAAMDTTGVDFCLDVHGDEELPYNFLSGPEGIEGYAGSRAPALNEVFAASYQRANPDLQRVHGYPIDAPGEANMTMCTNAVAARFGGAGFTLEMPFKDNRDAPDPVEGWSPRRCEALGASCVDALVSLAEAL